MSPASPPPYQSLNRLGLRVVVDVVYNHVHGSGPHDPHSVLDKTVPAYYLRRNLEGAVENSTCMNNTACEHYMMDRLVVDDLLHWATNYKVTLTPPPDLRICGPEPSA